MELVPTDQVAREFSVTAATMRSKLFRAGVQPVARQPGKGGVNLYDRADIDRLKAEQNGATK